MAHVIQEETAIPSSSPLTPASQHGDHERLFRLLEEVGPAPAEFMLNVSDPFIDREVFFEEEDES